MYRWVISEKGEEDDLEGFLISWAKVRGRGMWRSGDWGDLDSHDRAANEAALKNGTRLLSSYNIEDGKVWIITEADRSSTTFLLPEEY